MFRISKSKDCVVTGRLLLDLSKINVDIPICNGRAQSFCKAKKAGLIYKMLMELETLNHTLIRNPEMLELLNFKSLISWSIIQFIANYIELYDAQHCLASLGINWYILWRNKKSLILCSVSQSVTSIANWCYITAVWTARIDELIEKLVVLC